MDNEDICTLCDKPLQIDADNIVNVRSKGLQTFINKSQSREDEKFQLWIGKESVTFHETCRKRYSALPSKATKRKRNFLLSSGDPCSSSSSLPSSLTPNVSDDFQFDEYCFICNKVLDPYHKKVCNLKQSYTYQNLLNVGSIRNDEVGIAVMNRLAGISFEEKKPRYHYICYKAFLHKPSVSSEEITEPYNMDIEPCNVSAETDNSIEDIYYYIEESGKFQFFLSELQNLIENKMSNKVLCCKLKEKYDNDIFILKHRGRETVIYYKTINLTKICSDWLSKKSIDNFEKNAVVNFAAEILRAEILSSKYDNSSYPPPQKFLDNVNSEIPQLLQNFLNHLLPKGKQENNEDSQVKHDIIAHSIVSFLRPRAFLSKLQLALGIYIYRKTGSRLIIDLLSKFGVSATYKSIQLYEASTIINPPVQHIDSAFVQFIFDNTDHNVGTLDGHETFHCLGGVAVYTPDFEVVQEGGSKKCSTMPTAAEIASHKHIKTYPCNNIDSDLLQNIEFNSVKTLHLGDRPVFPIYYATYIWGQALEIPKLSSWKGFMERISEDKTYSLSNITCLPFINQPPSKLTTLNTALHYAAAEAQKINQKTTFVTFDQPLYWKARCIIAQSKDNELKNVVVRLGGFHLLMSYLGAIGYIMDGSGLEEMWSTVYAPESVKKMLTGHAFSRAVRAHILSFTAIGIFICKSMSNTTGVENFISEFFNEWKEKAFSMDDCKNNYFMQHLSAEFVQKLDYLESTGPTSKLWIQYFRCVTIALQFIEAERLGDWKLHLQSIKDMLPIFYSSGHFAYAKSAQVYLQDMENLDVIMDHFEFERYTKDGYFTIRRSDKAWSGVWSDMIIEQTLNRFFGTDLKHGRGVTPSVVARYLFAMPSAFNVMESLENYCDMKSCNSEQHVDLSNSRVTRDKNDINEFVIWLQNRSPFKHRVLVSLSTGIVGGPNIDCHKAFEKGRLGMEDMVGKNAKNVSMSNIFKVKNLASAATGVHLETDNEVSTIDIYLIFQRICVVFNGNAEKTREAFSYELTPYPLSLFDEKGFMRKTPKSKLYELFKPCRGLQLSKANTTYVIDGGWLLHAVVWPHSQKYEQVFQLYLSYITKHFGTSITVVFDGYNNEHIGVKSYERYMRREKNVGADVHIAEDKMITLNQTKFLSNICNKLNFVDLLAKYFQKNGIATRISDEDADTVIIRTAMELKDKTENMVVVVGNDIDLLILLITHCFDGRDMYFYKISPNNKKNEIYSSRDHRYLEKYILFAHAFAGCDSTSAIYNKGKKSIIALLEKNEDLRKLISIFYKPYQKIDDLYEVAENIIMKLYGAVDQNLSLHELRYKIFCTSTAVIKKELSLSSLPPTASVLKEHTKRVYYQMQIWLGFDLDPVLWGWKRTSNMMLPVMNTKPLAPKELLEMVFCGCKTNCNTSRCSCKKAGIKCSYSCKNCNGQSCENSSNSAHIIFESDTEEQENNIEEDNENLMTEEVDDVQEEMIQESED